MQDQTNCGMLSIRFAFLSSILLATNLFALGQAIPSGRTAEGPQSLLSRPAERSETPPSFSVFSPAKAQRLEETYYPMTPSQRLRWFITSTVGPAHLAGVAFVSAYGTAVNRPGRYGPHWPGFADRSGMGVAGSATGNALEAGAGFFLHEDPRYFRVSQHPIKARVGNVVRLTFSNRGGERRFVPAYARFLGILGSNFVSNTWRAHSEANVHDGLLRSTEGFGGRMAANAFHEFWPDAKKYIFHTRHRAGYWKSEDAH